MTVDTMHRRHPVHIGNSLVSRHIRGVRQMRTVVTKDIPTIEYRTETRYGGTGRDGHDIGRGTTRRSDAGYRDVTNTRELSRVLPARGAEDLGCE
ncbi:hypothetical protein Athai_63980 [Actinocatenispora thailandica]|uniref:Uncharacterized protein n=1 Tax=Actinocatenispora thailandica TaxID=227318 RepID=A0A7R7DW07_9ACTN|nr:hypothetical protein Athai_63980 [Actinocatenispora thailandica]